MTWRIFITSGSGPGNLADRITALKPINNGIHKRIHRIRPRGALPDHQYTPSGLSQQFRFGQIPSPIAVEFFRPEPGPGVGDAEISAALVRVPKAPMNEHHRPETRQHDIGATGQSRDMQTVAETSGMQAAPDQHFGLRVLAPDP